MRSIKLVLADGSVVEASPTENSELFYGAIGGYGGLGVIVEAELELADERAREAPATSACPLAEYRALLPQRACATSPTSVFHNADLYPPHYTTVRAVTWCETDEPVTVADRLQPHARRRTRCNRYFYWAISETPFGKWLRAERARPAALPQRAGALAQLRGRATTSPSSSRASRASSTYVLQEYFVPVERFDEFVPQMRDIFQRHRVNVINVSIRHALPDPGTLLAWARERDVRVRRLLQAGPHRAEASAGSRLWTRELIDAAPASGGTYYLPYQPPRDAEQFSRRVSARAGVLRAEGSESIPKIRFQQRACGRSMAREPHADLRAALAKLDHYRKPEGQALLTVPEWYLVFNPVEYAEHLRAGKTGRCLSARRERERVLESVQTRARDDGWHVSGQLGVSDDAACDRRQYHVRVRPEGRVRDDARPVHVLDCRRRGYRGGSA